MFCLSPTQSKLLVKSLYFVKEGIPSIQMKAVTQVLQVPKWAFKRENTEQTNINRPFSVSAAPLSECCSLLWASQYPVKAVWLHPQGPAAPAAACWWRQKEKNTLCKVISELMFPLRGWHIVVRLCFRAYSVMVVSRSLSLRFWSSRCASFSRSCERVVSRQTSNSCTFSWSWATCCSASRSWCKTTTTKKTSKFNYLNQRRCSKIGRNGWTKWFLPACSGPGSPPRWAGQLDSAPESRYAAGSLSSVQIPSDTSSLGCWCACLDCGSV